MNLNNKNKSATVFNYSEYLRNYYNRLASGLEKIPSDAELSLFLRQLGNVGINKNSHNDTVTVDESIDELDTLKMIA